MSKLNIPPVIIGQIYFKDQFGRRQVPNSIHFTETWEEGEGNAVTMVSSDIYGTNTFPIFMNRGDRPLCIPGYAGLKCAYDNHSGTIRNFYESWN